jgi:hypothetical protein
VKTLVLVLATRISPFPELVRTIKETWAAAAEPDVGVLFYYGGERLELEGDSLTVPTGDDLPNVGHKMLACFAHVLERFDFDIVFRTNCSTYVDLPNLRRYVEEHASPTRFYAGKGAFSDGVDFATGTGIFLSRDLVQLAVDDREHWDHSHLDDVALAKALHAHGVTRQFAPRVVYERLRDVRKVDTSQFHFRCKTAPTESASREEDARIMRAVHDAFCAARGEQTAVSGARRRFWRPQTPRRQ